MIIERLTRTVNSRLSSMVDYFLKFNTTNRKTFTLYVKKTLIYLCYFLCTGLWVEQTNKRIQSKLLSEQFIRQIVKILQIKIYQTIITVFE